MTRGRRIHLHADKAGLIIDVVSRWPASRVGITNTETGKPYETLHDLVQAIIDVPTRYVPIGCPTPAEDGRCPGHEEPGPGECQFCRHPWSEHDQRPSDPRGCLAGWDYDSTDAAAAAAGGCRCMARPPALSSGNDD